MPCARGIKCFLSTNNGKHLITEYPHPDSTSMGLGDGQSVWRYAPLPRKTSDGPSTSSRFSVRGTKTNPTVSVYVPSSPGSPFYIHYQVNQVPDLPCRFIFFKVHINGRQIMAWGIDTASEIRGRISISLWLPGLLYDGQPGVEKRNLVFLPGQEQKSIADDGGLIEIQVFRASARRPRAPVLNEFRYHDNYGVATPSIGLIPAPQSLGFHSYTLIDPKDLPYATFRFHYRSEQSLRQLNLIPADDRLPDDWKQPPPPPTRPPPPPPNLHPVPSLAHTARPSDDVFAPEAQHQHSTTGTAISLDKSSYRFRPLPQLPMRRPGRGGLEYNYLEVIAPPSPNPSLTASIRELLWTGELDPEDAVFVAPVGVVTAPEEEGGGEGAAVPVLVMGEVGAGAGEGVLDRRGLEEVEGWLEGVQGGTPGTKTSPVRKRGVERLFSGLFGKSKGKGKEKENERERESEKVEGKEKGKEKVEGKGKGKAENGKTNAEEKAGWGVYSKSVGGW